MTYTQLINRLNVLKYNLSISMEEYKHFYGIQNAEECIRSNRLDAIELNQHQAKGRLMQEIRKEQPTPTCESCEEGYVLDHITEVKTSVTESVASAVLDGSLVEPISSASAAGSSFF